MMTRSRWGKVAPFLVYRITLSSRRSLRSIQNFTPISIQDYNELQAISAIHHFGEMTTVATLSASLHLTLTTPSPTSSAVAPSPSTETEIPSGYILDE